MVRPASDAGFMDQIIPASVEHQSERFAEGLLLDCGERIAPLVVAFRTYGRLSPRADNAILVCHALTGDQYVAEPHPVTGRPGWWSRLVGPGLPVDTDRFFVVCANVLGGCMGSTGPRSPREGDGGADGDPGAPWGTAFPPVTVRDMVRAQAMLVTRLGIDRLFAVIGGSMGGMQVLSWAATFPERVFAAIPVATAPFHSAQNIAFNEVSRQAIFADPDWCGGRYWAENRVPARGLAVARMMAHITYLSEQALTRKFGRRVQRDAAPPEPRAAQTVAERDAAELGAVAAGPAPAAGVAGLFGEMFQVESYLRHQGSSFVRRFDANSYLTVTRAMDFFDLAAEHGDDLAAAFRGSSTRFCIVSFSSDWLFPTAQSRLLARALNRAAANASFVEIHTDKGHDAFLLDEPDLDRTVRGFLRGCAEHAGLDAPS